MASRSATREHGRFGPDVIARVGGALRRHEGFDLEGYRPAYVERRLASRLTATSETPEGYASIVEADAEERRRLVEALGINVTHFFRDPAVWQFLEEVALPPRVDQRLEAGEPLRALSLGCAGGQEAYSAAMLLAELVGGELERFQVDAWDMDGAALEVAREGWYPRAALEGLSRPAIERYFLEDGEGYRVDRAIRERVRVARRDMLTERLGGEFDIVFLRNVIIYFEQAAKEDLLRRVHEILTTGGLLVLGQAETVATRAEGLFRPLSLRNRVYARVAV